MGCGGAVVALGLAAIAILLFAPEDSGWAANKSEVTAFAESLGPGNNGSIPDGFLPCTIISKRLVLCVESNDHGINNCRCYLDLLKDCRKD